MKLSQMINKNEIITVVGAGGKTSLINYFANYYRDSLNVLLTTTTKIYLPYKKDYDNLFMTNDGTIIIPSICCGVTVCGSYINNENKVVGIDVSILDKIVDKFDLVLIEGDGSKRKKLKGWNDKEPVVSRKTTSTIGILDITSLGMYINEDNIHRLDRFKDIINFKNYKNGNNVVTIDDLKNLVLHKDGLFKNCFGKKILFINKVEDENYEKLAIDLSELIKNNENEIDIFYGSIKQEFCARY